MVPRTFLTMLAVMTALLAAPGAVSPVDEATAYCYQIEGVDDCFNPCMDAAGAYNLARETTGTQDKTPDMHCPA